MIEYLTLALEALLAMGLAYVVISSRARSHIKVFLIKNFFEHRYDYRVEWIRFSTTIGASGNAHLSLHERAIRSLADVTDSVGGVFLLPDNQFRLSLTASWRLDLPDADLGFGRINDDWRLLLTRDAYIIDLDEIRFASSVTPQSVGVPAELLSNHALWILVPLIRSEQLVGIIALGRPPIRRSLDWEDFDLLRVIGQQVAVYVAEAESHLKLQEARRFDEFNRRFAYIIHDIKNIVSQISIVTENAQEHWDNPRFQESMNKTLNSATKKMMALLARLSPGATTYDYQLVSVDPALLPEKIAHGETRNLTTQFSGLKGARILVDEERFVFAVRHIVANAFDASAPGAEVALTIDCSENLAIITIRDHGIGMSQAFIREQLFKPFTSTKAGGFGIGAAEARDIIIGMGGSLDVSSTVGEGTVFYIRLPLHFDT